MRWWLSFTGRVRGELSLETDLVGPLATEQRAWAQGGGTSWGLAWRSLWLECGRVSVLEKGARPLQTWAFGWLGSEGRVGSQLWAGMSLELDTFDSLIDFILALEGSEGKIS